MPGHEPASRLPLKGADLALLLLLLALSFLPLLLTGARQEGSCADITLQGKLQRRVVLTGHRGTERFQVETEKGRNIIEVRDESIAIVEADCPDKLCVKAGSLTKAGETAACLPHGLLVEVKGGPGTAQDDVIMVR